LGDEQPMLSYEEFDRRFESYLEDVAGNAGPNSTIWRFHERAREVSHPQMPRSPLRRVSCKVASDASVEKVVHVPGDPRCASPLSKKNPVEIGVGLW